MMKTEIDKLSGLFFQIIRLHYQRNQMLLDRVGMYPGQPPLLIALSWHDGQSQKELATKLHIKAATLTVMLRRMEKGGIIERRQDADDQRVSRVYLTDKGKEVCFEMQKVMRTLREETFQHFSQVDREELQRLFTQMRDNLAEATGKNPYCPWDEIDGQE